MSKSVSRGLTEARELVEHGWTQGHYKDNDGRYCIRGALGQAFNGDALKHFSYKGEVLYTAEELVLQAVGGWPLNDHSRLECWNDNLRWFGKRRVLKAFRWAIEEARRLETAETKALCTPFPVQVVLPEQVMVDPVFDAQIDAEIIELMKTERELILS